MGKLRFALVLHNHQPVGNFDQVIEAAYEDSYRPFLDVVEKYPEIPFCLHTSGCLMEWLVEHHPDYLDRVRRRVEAGGLEILGGGFYEPILSMIPPRDRIGQIRGYSEYLTDLTGATVRGMWVAERVWEQSMVVDIAAAGIEYTVLDDAHFRHAGVRADSLFGYFTTEDQGQVLRIFPGSETMRYMIPFRDVEEFIGYLRHVHHQHPNAVVVFADDGEKFGTWPDTKAHVYQHGWIYRFLDALRAHQDWIEVSTLAGIADSLSPVGRTYLPDGSYREMTEWALPTDRLLDYQRSCHEFDHHPGGAAAKEFLRGTSWRNFKVKYPETVEMYARMMEISERLESVVREDRRAFGSPIVNDARVELYRGQCNCPYWHGAFGGLYLPHLRGAVYRHLIRADNLLESYEREGDLDFAEVQVRDFDFDGRPEVKLSTDRLALYVSPARGGQITEFDVRDAEINLGASLARRPEAYHEAIRNLNHDSHQHGDARSIHDRVVCKQPGLEDHLIYDSHPRKCLVDHFFSADADLNQVRSHSAQDRGDFAGGAYTYSPMGESPAVGAVMTRTAPVDDASVTLVKTLSVAPQDDTLRVRYRCTNLPRSRPIRFAIEWNFAALATGADDRYFVDADGHRLGLLGEVLDIASGSWLGLIDEWLGVEIGLGASKPGGLWVFPVQSVSQSEGGFELVHQSICVIQHWELNGNIDPWEVDLTLTADAGRARERKLAASSEGQSPVH